MAIDMSQFYQVFFEESTEHLAEMESLLLSLDVSSPDPEQLNAIFRAAHSIKGSAGTFGFTDMAETTHVLESLLDRIRKQELSLRPEMVDAFLESGDVLRSMLDAHQDRGEVDPSAVASICTRLRQLSADVASPPPVHHSETNAVLQPEQARRHVFDIQFVPTEASAKGDGVANLLEELRRLGDVEVLVSPGVESGNLGLWEIKLTTGVKTEAFSDLIDFISDDGAWRVSDDMAAALDGMPVVDHSSGLPAEIRCAEPVPPQENEGYGFFAPLPEVIEEGDGFGFFVPVPAISSLPAPAHEVSVPVAPQEQAASPDAHSRLAKPGAVVDSSIRVSVEKVDQLINLVGELVITQAMLLQTTAELRESASERLMAGLVQLERNTRDLQESVMSIRMMPISFVFSRFPRVVRDLSGKLGKQVELKTSGETTELDRGLIERIADPLTHLIRNSLDHGIELPDLRIAAGKSPVGTITLKAYHQGGNIVIEVGDDGAGLPRAKILAKAKEKGLPVSDQMTDQEIFNLIFEAGFSTADQVTDVSGRGVGMDVVRRNIQAMGGRVEIDSMLGIGTRMTVRLPLTLAILDGMSVSVGEQIYILPLSYVIESLQPLSGDIKTLSNQARVIQVRGEYLPVVVLHEVFNLALPVTDFTRGIMVVLDADGARVALYVDALVGQHQVVIKSLEANYRRVAGISGATIMGDGHVALILDVSVIVGMARTISQMAGVRPQ